MTHLRKLALITAATAAALGCFGLSSVPAQASEIGSNRKIGIGGMLGAPTGLSLKVYFNPRHALDFGLGVGYWGGATVLVHGDYKLHFPLVRAPDFDLPLYFGVGAKLTLWFTDHDHRYWGSWGGHDGYVGVGIRVPVGIAFNLNRIPLDFFLEVVPGVGLFPGIGFFVDGAIGVRYYF
ncbi:MAG: DUF3996 domain-containing protein [Polyangia bacterium]|jgi:hypothetical protein|nr:DUF3996 domain-containing protein [Polyangia bacterium]